MSSCIFALQSDWNKQVNLTQMIRWISRGVIGRMMGGMRIEETLEKDMSFSTRWQHHFLKFYIHHFGQSLRRLYRTNQRARFEQVEMFQRFHWINRKYFWNWKILVCTASWPPVPTTSELDFLEVKFEKFQNSYFQNLFSNYYFRQLINHSRIDLNRTFLKRKHLKSTFWLAGQWELTDTVKELTLVESNSRKFQTISQIDRMPLDGALPALFTFFKIF